MFNHAARVSQSPLKDDFAGQKEPMLMAERGQGNHQSYSNHPKLTSKPPSRFSIVRWLKNPEHLLVTLTVVAVVAGSAFGLIFKYTVNPGKEALFFLSFPGDLLMNMLKMLIIPLIISSLISGLAGLDPRSSGRMGSYALLYYFVTTMAAVILGIILVLIIRPGNTEIKMNLGNGTRNDRRPSTIYAFLDLFKNLFPPNLVKACLQQTQTDYVYKSMDVFVKVAIKNNLTNNSYAWNETYGTLQENWNSETNVLGLVMFSMFFGLILGQMGEKALIMVQFFSALNEIVMNMVRIIMWYSPVGIFFLVMSKILQIENLAKTAQALGMYMLTIVLGLVIHSCGTLSLTYLAITKKNPFTFFKGMFQAFITALGTASSAATLPLTFRCLEGNLHIDKRVTRFVLPIGATINMDGTALYEAVASIFIAQMNNRQLSIIEVFTVSFTATLAAIGAASVPSAGLVTMILVLSAVGLPTEDVSLILAVDWLLDRLRTSVNVLGDAYGAGIVDHLCRKELAQHDAEIAREAADFMGLALNDQDVEGGTGENNGSPRRVSTGGGLGVPGASSKKRLSVAVAMMLNEEEPLGGMFAPKMGMSLSTSYCRFLKYQTQSRASCSSHASVSNNAATQQVTTMSGSQSQQQFHPAIHVSDYSSAAQHAAHMQEHDTEM